MTRPSLSLCAIAKDEQELLPRMLRSVRGLADEIVLVDTGSTDRTVDIARQNGARVVEQPFRDDFSQARNRSLREARGEWILVLDADEYLAPGAADAIREAIRDPGILGYYLPFENQLGGGRVHRCGILRLFRSRPDVRYEYVIHEQVIPSLAEVSRKTGLCVATLEAARVIHDGYVPYRYEARRKAERNRRLFRIQVERYPDHIYSWYKYGDFLRRFDDEDDRREAMRALFRARDLLLAADPEYARQLSFSSEVFALLAVDHDNRGDPERALVLAREGLERFGPSPNLLFVLGHLLARFGRHRDALSAYARLRSYDGRVLPIPPEPGATSTHAFLGMGRALANLGYARAARRCFEKSIEADPRQIDARLALARLLLDTGRTDEASALYDEVLAIDDQHVGARLRQATLLLLRGDALSSQRHLLRALDHGGDPRLIGPMLGQCRLATGDYEGAYRVFQETPDQPEARTGIQILTALANGQDPRASISGPRAAVWRTLLRRSGALRADAPS